MTLTAKKILKEYKFGLINLFEATKKLRHINIPPKKCNKILMNINRKNILLITDYLAGTIENGDSEYLSEINRYDFDKNQDEEYYFDIEFEE